MPTREFFLAISTLAALLWVSLLVEAHLQPRVILGETIKSLRARLAELRAERESLGADGAQMIEQLRTNQADLLEEQTGLTARRNELLALNAELAKQHTNMSSLDAALLEQSRAMDTNLQATEADVASLTRRIAGNIERAFGQLSEGDDQSLASASSNDDRPQVEGLAAAQLKLLSLTAARSDQELGAMMLDENRVGLANRMQEIHAELASTTRTISDLQNSLGTIEDQLAEARERLDHIAHIESQHQKASKRVERIAHMQSMLHRWMPIFVTATGGVIQVFSLMALYDEAPSLTSTVIVIVGLTLLATAFTATVLMRFAAETLDTAPITAGKIVSTMVVAAVLLIGPIVAGAIGVTFVVLHSKS